MNRLIIALLLLVTPLGCMQDIPPYVTPLITQDVISSLHTLMEKVEHELENSTEYAGMNINDFLSSLQKHPLQGHLYMFFNKLFAWYESAKQLKSKGISFNMNHFQPGQYINEDQLISEHLSCFFNPAEGTTVQEWILHAKKFVDVIEQNFPSILVSPYLQLTPEQHAELRSNPQAALAHEQWYCNNVGSTVSWPAFEGNWCQPTNVPSRMYVREHIKEKNYHSMLDAACGMCVEYDGLQDDSYAIDYTGIDITPQLVSRAQARSINVIEGSIEAIPFADNSFDVAYARWVLESLPYYDTAINEMVRVARDEVMIVFFMPLHETTEETIQVICWPGPYLFYNQYSKPNIEALLTTNKKVVGVRWYKLPTTQETVLHIQLERVS